MPREMAAAWSVDQLGTVTPASASAEQTLARAMVGPIERSMPPVTMTNVAPTAQTAMW